MKNSGPWIGGLVAAVLFAMRGFAPSTSIEKPTHPPPPTPAAKDEAADVDEWKKLHPKVTDQLTSYTRKFDGATTSSIPIKYVIATVPDPFDSSSGHRFDSTIESIRLAAASLDYVYVDHNYPWSAYRPTPKIPPTAVRIYEENCGMVLFRDKDRGHFLAVLLVGETAVRGPSPKAFKDALDIGHKQECKSAIQILGPYFSGSQRPLRELVKQWRGANDKVQVGFVSGTATALEPNQDQRDPITFHSTLIPEIILLKHALERANVPVRGEQKDFAFLHESGTFFGSKLVFLKNAGDANERPPRIAFPFPLNISSFRSSYERAKEGEDAMFALPSIGSKLHISLVEEINARDRPPTFNPNLAAVETELALNDLCTDIQKERIRYVLIASTEIKDQLFLAKFVRTRCPNVTMIFTRNDRLFWQPQYLPFLKGSIIASTYPLYLRTQQWSPGKIQPGRRLVFASDLEQGIYNAAAIQINKTLGGGQPVSLVDYSAPFSDEDCCKVRPPVWISIIGQNGPQPLSLVDDWPKDPRSEMVVENPFPDKQLSTFKPRFSGFWMVVYYFTLAAALGCVVRFLAGTWPIDHQPAAAWTWVTGKLSAALTKGRPMGQSETPRANKPIDPSWYLPIFWVAMSIGLVLFATASFAPLAKFHSFPGAGTIAFVFYILTAVLLFAALVGAAGCLIRSMMILPRTPRLFVGMGLLGLAIGILLFFAWLWHLPLHQHVFFFDRSTAISNAVNPLVPGLFLCAGWLAWSYYHVIRLWHRANRPPGFFSDPALIKIKEIDEGFSSPVAPTPRSLMQHGLVLLGLGLIACRISYLRSGSVEGPWFDWIIFIMLILFTYAIAETALLNWIRFDKIGKLLRQISFLPLEQAFQRIPRNVANRCGPFFGTENHKQETILSALERQRGVVLALAIRVRDISETLPEPKDPESTQGTWNFGANAPTVEAYLSQVVARQNRTNPSAATQLSSASQEAKNRSPFQSALDDYHRAEEDLVALSFLQYLSYFFIQLRNGILFLMIGSVALLLAVLSYPVQPQVLWSSLAGAIVLAIAVGVVFLALQIERDPVISAMTQTTPDRVDWLSGSFVPNIAAYVLPLIGLLAAVSANFSDLFHWFDPLLRAFW